MKLIIHDFPDEETKRGIREDPADCVLIGDKGTIMPCIGCFGCWKKTPGKCVVSDGYDSMGELIHAADEVIVYSRLTFGGFSGFVKNVFDRSLSYVLPHFELVDGESHHMKRYSETKDFSFRFRGSGMTEKEKDLAKKYVKAVCTNIRGNVKEVTFEETEDSQDIPEGTQRLPSEETVILNVSMREKRSNSAKLAGVLTQKMSSPADTVYLRDHLRDIDGLMDILSRYERIVLAMPLYVDGMPSQTIRLFERIRDKGELRNRKIFLLANMGLYETVQLSNMLSQVKLFCEKTGNDYMGAVAVGAGELVGGLMELISADSLFLKDIGKALGELASSVDRGSALDDIFTGPVSFPRRLYIAIANSGWKRGAKENGLRKQDLFRQY